MSTRTPAYDPALIEAHCAFLDRLGEERVLELAGPFGDRAYLLAADALAAATALAQRDPLHRGGSSLVTVREWKAR